MEPITPIPDAVTPVIKPAAASKTLLLSFWMISEVDSDAW